MTSLPLTIDKNDATPLWIQIRDQIISLISHGELEPEQKMPTVRGLAAQLGISVGMVNQAYRYLRLTGYLESRQGSGVRVRRRTDFAKREDFDEIGRLTEEYVDRLVALGIPLMETPNTVSYFVHSRQLGEQADEA